MNRIITTLLVLFAVSTLSAQNQQIKVEKRPHQTKKYTVAAHPLYTFDNGIRVDFEVRIKDTPAWIQIGTAGHWLTGSENGYNNGLIFSGNDINWLRGARLDLNYKRFFNRKETLYFAGGCTYIRYNAKYYDEYWDSYIENKLEYQVQRQGTLKQNIDKVGVSAYFGYQIPRSTFLCDMFVGLGYRYSFRSNDKAKLFNDNMLSIGYKGVVFITGVRLGAKFKQ
jgi:hypothetical protein